MKKLLILSFIVYCSSFIVSNAQIINTYAGNYPLGGGYSGDGGPATLAELMNPASVSCDASGNLYIADASNNVIRMVNSSGVISTAVGSYPGPGYSGDGGPASAAELYFPYGVFVDAPGNLFIADYMNNVVRKVNTSGIITTIAGNNRHGYSGDGGPATSAELFYPCAVTVNSSGNVYIADIQNNVIRMVNTSGTITTIAGNYSYGVGYSGDGGMATNAELHEPTGIAFDPSGNLDLVDFQNNVVRQVNTAGIITTIAGNHIAGISGDGGPATAAEFSQPVGITVDVKGNMYISDGAIVRVVNTSGIINLYAGTYAASGFSGDGGPATDAELYNAQGMAVDNNGNLYIGDVFDHVVRKVNAITTGTDQAKTSEGIIVYPNPSDGIFTIQSSVVSNQWSVEIYNVLGEKVYSQPFLIPNSQFLIDLSSNPNGIYFYRVISENGGLVGEGKVIIQK